MPLTPEQLEQARQEFRARLDAMLDAMTPEDRAAWFARRDAYLAELAEAVSRRRAAAERARPTKRALTDEYVAMCHVLLTGDPQAQERRAAIEAEFEQRWPGRWTRVEGTLVGTDMNAAQWAIYRAWFDARHP